MSYSLRQFLTFIMNTVVNFNEVFFFSHHKIYIAWNLHEHATSATQNNSKKIVEIINVFAN